MRKRILYRGGLAAALAALLMSTVQSSQADEWYPGLPDTTFGAWSNASQGGLSYAKRAKQWFRSPAGMTVAEVFYGNGESSDPSVRAFWVRAEGYLVSPAGAPANYGYLEPMTVRSVGFGLMPVEATVQVSQRRKDGYPVPISVRLEWERAQTSGPGGPRFDNTYKATVITDAFEVRILSARVDGVDLGLNGDCRTVEPAPVTMSSPEYAIEDAYRTESTIDDWFRSADPASFFHPTRGGQLTGSMTIPPFTGCTTTAGDDLSDLLTLSASGPDNPIMARTGWPCAFSKDGVVAPAPPGASNPRRAGELGGRSDGRDSCAGSKPFEYPNREDR